MYLILHAFSRRNSGDGLLVDLTLEVLQAAGIAPSDCILLALDPESFHGDEIQVVPAPGEPSARLTPRLLRAGLSLGLHTVSSGRLGALSKLMGRASGMIAVGGGYLVADSAVRQSGVLVNHFAQLSGAAVSNVPTIYLPQSIGPLQGPVGKLTRSKLAGLDRLYLRDDLSMEELNLPNTRRIGDLAVLKLAREIKSLKPLASEKQTVLIARELPRSSGYPDRLKVLAEQVDQPIWAVQADTQGPRSDRAFYNRHGWQDQGAMSDLMAKGLAGTVISVRLHGAIAALLAGRPAIHLAYERKGWGAYQDLGIAEFVHDARDFDPGLVTAQAKALNENPDAFWDRIRKAGPALERQYTEMVEDLRERLNSQC